MAALKAEVQSKGTSGQKLNFLCLEDVCSKALNQYGLILLKIENYCKKNESYF